MELQLSATFQGLGDAQHIHRERALQQFNSILRTPDLERGVIDDIESGLRDLLTSPAWERRLGGFLGAAALLQTLPAGAFDEFMIKECMRLLEDDEFRVRLAVGDCLHHLAVKLGPAVYEECSARLLSSIHENYDRDGEGDKRDQQAALADKAADEGLLTGLLARSYQRLKPGTGDLRHGSEGWKCLETSMKALHRLVDGIGAAFKAFVTPDLQALLVNSARHPNRYVRETCHLTMASLFRAFEGPDLAEIGQSFASCLLDGMTDNWSQVIVRECGAEGAAVWHATLCKLGRIPSAVP